MFPTRRRIMLLHLSGNVIRPTADHPLYVQGKGWINAADLRPGDPLLSHDGQRMPVEGVADSGEQGAGPKKVAGTNGTVERVMDTQE